MTHAADADLPRPAVFLDRDGVINLDTGYPHKISDLTFVEGAIGAIAAFCARGFLTICVTNQGGVGKQLYTEADVHAFHQAIRQELGENDARIDAFYHCPHHPEAPEVHMRRCDCRKPKPGMILRALDDWPIDPAASLLIGDRDSDIRAAEAAGIRGHLFPGGNLLDFCSSVGLFR